MSEPIMEFKDMTQARECLREWQTRLFLDDWTIKLSLTKDLDGNWGMNEMVSTNSDCHIRLLSKKDDTTITKFCHEKILVHELLHCKYYYASYTEDNQEYVNEREHQLLEQMAKSLIMAKYGLTFDWFKNF